MLHKDRIGDSKDDPIVRDYNDAMRLLQLTADGKFSLGAEDTSAPAGAGSPDWSSPERQFTRETMSDF
jgi:phage gp36-like protein